MVLAKMVTRMGPPCGAASSCLMSRVCRVPIQERAELRTLTVVRSTLRALLGARAPRGACWVMLPPWIRHKDRSVSQVRREQLSTMLGVRVAARAWVAESRTARGESPPARPRETS